MSKQKIQLSDHFDYSRLIRFVLPCIGTMLFTSIYGIVDGLCVSNFVGKSAFAAVNLIMPVPMLVGTVGLWCDHVRILPVRGGVCGLRRGQRAHRQLPLWCQ